MTTMILSGKRQVVLPAELCRQVSLAPGARVTAVRELWRLVFGDS